jgi:hypothetical protein
MAGSKKVGFDFLGGLTFNTHQGFPETSAARQEESDCTASGLLNFLTYLRAVRSLDVRAEVSPLGSSITTSPRI